VGFAGPARVDFLTAPGFRLRNCDRRRRRRRTRGLDQVALILDQSRSIITGDDLHSRRQRSRNSASFYLTPSITFNAFIPPKVSPSPFHSIDDRVESSPSRVGVSPKKLREPVRLGFEWALAMLRVEKTWTQLSWPDPYKLRIQHRHSRTTGSASRISVIYILFFIRSSNKPHVKLSCQTFSCQVAV
jgi:hypothetical protein